MILNKQLYTFIDEESHIEQEQLEFEPLEGYTFYSQMDSFGDDIGFYGQQTMEEYKNICERENGKCFNTLGYVKSQVTPEQNFIYLPTSRTSNAGLYVKNA